MHIADQKYIEGELAKVHEKLDLIIDTLNLKRIVELKKQIVATQEELSKPVVIIPGGGQIAETHYPVGISFSKTNF